MTIFSEARQNAQGTLIQRNYAIHNDKTSSRTKPLAREGCIDVSLFSNFQILIYGSPKSHQNNPLSCERGFRFARHQVE